jgi:hypothetical protein
LNTRTYMNAWRESPSAGCALCGSRCPPSDWPTILVSRRHDRYTEPFRRRLEREPDDYFFALTVDGAAGFDLPLPEAAGAGALADTAAAFFGSGAPIRNSMKSRRSRAL